MPSYSQGKYLAEQAHGGRHHYFGRARPTAIPKVIAYPVVSFLCSFNCLARDRGLLSITIHKSLASCRITSVVADSVGKSQKIAAIYTHVAYRPIRPDDLAIEIRKIAVIFTAVSVLPRKS